MTRRLLPLLLLPFVAAANVTPTNAFRHSTMPIFGKAADSALPLQQAVTNAERRAEILAGVRPGLSRNWYAPMFAATNPPAPAVCSDPVWADALLLPEGEPCTGMGAARTIKLILADEDVCRGIVARFRDGRIAPTNLPVRINHGGAVVGRIEDLFYVPGDGVWGRLQVEREVSLARDEWGVSPELFCLSTPCEDEWGVWGLLVIPRYFTGVALCDDPSILQLRKFPIVSFSESPLPYPTTYYPKHPQ